MKISIITPAYNEDPNLPLLYQRILALDWKDQQLDWEWLVVDDHSHDGTDAYLQHLAEINPRVHHIRFARNFGSHAACAAGLELCTGNAAVVLAADLQDPPETIFPLVNEWRAGSKVVWAVRADRPGESLLSLAFARIYYELMRRYTSAKLPPSGADFLLMDRLVIDALKAAPEKNTSLFALIQWMGFDQAHIAYTKAQRHGGVSKWNFKTRLKLAIDSFVGFSYVPIRATIVLGLSLAFLGFLYALFLIVRRFGFANPVEGWTSLICVVLITSGIQLLMLGTMGEYLWRCLDQTRPRPRFIIESIDGHAPGLPR
ncbi:glycosyltransferase family 2 protein [Opitutus sp. GAS368]|uniref:glycosyltransferase family 2 protein n=1 Tax=Opitutus sp. GAS368 TaxID=1882749 RepID=UPI00087AB682|nr:glycosyltransferase family 2 protein [Opitutus sp. GAS368]SDS26885.1 dolichol-phosphate mannosyltransferase [Opitutus sp. GAS368]